MEWSSHYLYNQIDCIITEERWYETVLQIQDFCQTELW